MEREHPRTIARHGKQQVKKNTILSCCSNIQHTLTEARAARFAKHVDKVNHLKKNSDKWNQFASHRKLISVSVVLSSPSSFFFFLILFICFFFSLFLFLKFCSHGQDPPLGFGLGSCSFVDQASTSRLLLCRGKPTRTGKSAETLLSLAECPDLIR